MITMTESLKKGVKKTEKLFRTPVFRVRFPSLFKPSTFGDTPKFQVTALFDPTQVDLKLMYNLALACARNKWGENFPDDVRAKFKSGYFRDGSEKSHAGFKGMKFLTLSRTEEIGAPGVVDAGLQPIVDKSEIYDGCYAVATVNLYCWSHNSGKKGVNFGLQNFQKIADGDKLVGTNPEDDFDPIDQPDENLENTQAGGSDDLDFSFGTGEENKSLQDLL